MELSSQLKKLIFSFKMGFAVVTSTQGRGVVSETNKMCLGAFNAVPLIEEFYKTLDLMLIVGVD